jgi:hypothetical protein
MSNNFIPFLLTLPVKLLYRILDNLDQLTILLSLRNVCIRANTIIDTYHRYQVNFTFFLKYHEPLLIKENYSKKTTTK